MKPLHPQVRIVKAGPKAKGQKYDVCLFTGQGWQRLYVCWSLTAAEERARWFSDALEHARRAALEEAVKVVDASRAILAFCECDPDIGHTGACKRLTDALQEYDAMKGVRDA